MDSFKSGPIKGDMVLCPCCGDKIATITRDIGLRDKLKIDMFSFAPGQRRESGDRANCKKCARAWMVGGRIFTERGWR